MSNAADSSSRQRAYSACEKASGPENGWSICFPYFDSHVSCSWLGGPRKCCWYPQAAAASVIQTKEAAWPFIFWLGVGHRKSGLGKQMINQQAVLVIFLPQVILTMACQCQWEILPSAESAISEVTFYKQIASTESLASGSTFDLACSSSHTYRGNIQVHK